MLAPSPTEVEKANKKKEKNLPEKKAVPKITKKIKKRLRRVFLSAFTGQVWDLDAAIPAVQNPTLSVLQPGWYTIVVNQMDSIQEDLPPEFHGVKIKGKLSQRKNNRLVVRKIQLY